MNFRNTKPFYILYIFAIILLTAGAWFYFNNRKPVIILPVYGERNADSSYHFIPDFQFTNQTGATVTNHAFDNSIYVTDFFFTHCPSICPTMTANLEVVAAEFKSEPRVKILSHTVDPRRDSVSVLLKYAEKHHANPNQWHFVTGTKKDLYDIARNGYLLSATEGDGEDGDFVHTQNMALVDWGKHIRGFYDGTDKEAMKKLSTHIKLLLEEYEWRENQK